MQRKDGADCSVLDAKLTVKQYQRAVLVFGDTHPVRELLKSLGLSWNRQLGGWIGTWSQRWGIIARLRDSPEVELTARRAAFSR